MLEVAHLVPLGGAFRDRHDTLGKGCDGRCGVRCLHRAKRFTAYGEVVWSWRRDPGVYPPRLVAGAATVTKKAAHRGEHEGNRQAIARGKPGLFWLNLW